MKPGIASSSADELVGTVAAVVGKVVVVVVVGVVAGGGVGDREVHDDHVRGTVLRHLVDVIGSLRDVDWIVRRIAFIGVVDKETEIRTG